MAMTAPSNVISRVRLGGWGGWGRGCEASKAYYLESEAVVSFPDVLMVSADGVSFGLNRAVLAATSNLLNGVLRSSSEEEAEELVIRQETGFFVITSQGQKECRHFSNEGKRLTIKIKQKEMKRLTIFFFVNLKLVKR